MTTTETKMKKIPLLIAVLALAAGCAPGAIKVQYATTDASRDHIKDRATCERYATGSLDAGDAVAGTIFGLGSIEPDLKGQEQRFRKCMESMGYREVARR